MGRLLPIPFICALCGGMSKASLCPACVRQFLPSSANRCSQCALPLNQTTTAYRCGACLTDSPAFDATIAVTDYGPPIDQLVLGLKFGGQLALANLIAEKLSEAAMQSQGSMPELLTAVPLGPQRLAQRGFNQALEIARPLARKLKIPLDGKLAVRTRETTAQALLPPDERRKNMHHAFAIPEQAAHRVRGRHIGIVDDVMTTGETLNALALSLKRSGAVRITNFVFARTL